MKKILIIATILTANIFAFDSVTYFGGVNAEGELTIKSPTGEQKQQQGYKLVAGMELNNELRNHKNIELGLGIKYEDYFRTDRKFWESGTYYDYGKVKFAATVPVYATAKYKFILDRTSNVYVKGDLGYNFAINGDYQEDVQPNTNVEGGLYTGVGIGFEANKVIGEINYNISRVKYVGLDSIERNYENAKVSATIGYKLDM